MLHARNKSKIIVAVLHFASDAHPRAWHSSVATSENNATEDDGQQNGRSLVLLSLAHTEGKSNDDTHDVVAAVVIAHPSEQQQMLGPFERVYHAVISPKDLVLERRNRRNSKERGLRRWYIKA